MSFVLHAVTQTRGIADDDVSTRYVYVDDLTGKTMTLLEPLYKTDDVQALMSVEPTRKHEEHRGVIKLVTTWAWHDPSTRS